MLWSLAPFGGAILLVPWTANIGSYLWLAGIVLVLTGTAAAALTLRPRP